MKQEFREPANPLKGKRSQYKISENFIAFWYRYVFSNRTEIERGNGDVYFNLALENIKYFSGVLLKVYSEFENRVEHLTYRKMSKV